MLKCYNFSKVLSIIICIAITFCTIFTFPMTSNASSQTSAITVATASQITGSGADFIDISLSSWNDDGTQYWLHSDNWGNYHQKTSGTKGNPLQTPIFEKSSANFFTNNNNINGDTWISSIYKVSDNNLLAFVHLENVAVTGKPSYQGRMGIAYSENNGDTFTYCGEIIAPKVDGGTAEEPYNIQGCPYIVKDGYIYVYFNEYGTNVARADLDDVIYAAQNDTVCSWYKYYNGGWSENGLGGDRTDLRAKSGVPVEGICHTQAAYSTYTGLYYLTMTQMNNGGQNTFVRLYQSSDCITWELYRVVVDEPAGNYPSDSGWQYSSIVDFGDEQNATVGQLFYLYCGNRPSDTTYMTWKRWTIDLTTAPIDLYNLDNDANDTAAGKNNGTVNGGAGYVTGKSGNAIDLDGSDDYINIPNNANLSGMTQLTVSCWVKLDSLPASNKYFVPVGKDSSDYQYRLAVDHSGTVHFVVDTSNNDWYTEGTVAYSSTQISTNTWYHLVGTYDGSDVKVYIDGVQRGIGDDEVFGPITSGTSPLTIGYNSNYGSIISYTDGKIDEVQIYNKGLNATEVDNLYDRYSLTATSHKASTEYSSSQGTNYWYYYNWAPGSITSMTWDSGNSRWYGSETYSLIGSSWQHPGVYADSARAWWSPGSNLIEIKGNASLGAGGDGVIVSIQKNGVVIWTSTLSPSTNENFDIITNVAYGDLIYFRVNCVGTNTNDTVYIDPTIIVYN